MGLSAHHKISATISILILMCTFGLRAIRAQETTEFQEGTTGLVEEIKAEDLDLERAESKDGQKLEIVKQIRKLNNDGSYTVGYEADDGTFKIESRDVLGNVKGTFGYVDVNGEIKRVSYIGNNGTGLKTDSVVEETTTIPKRNKGTPTTRRPTYSSSSTVSPTRATVIQTIPRRLRISSTTSTDRSGRDYSSSTTRSPPIKPSDPTTTVVYATSVPTVKSYVNIRPTPLPGTNMRQAEQIARPDKLEINQGSKIEVTRSKELSTPKPVVEEVDEKDETPPPYRGNLLRRQLMQDAESQYDTQHQIVYSSQVEDDARHVYGAVSSTARPLFTTTSSPRLPAVVLAARHRATQIQNSINLQQQQQQNQQQPTTEKYYIKTGRRQESQEGEQTTESTSENTYLTQSPIVPVQIPANRDDEKRIVRRPIQRSSPHFVRLVQQQQQQQPTTTGYDAPRLVRIPFNQSPQRPDESEQYLRETTTPPRREESAEQEPVPARIRQGFYRNPATPVPSPQQSQYYNVYPEQESSSPYPGYPLPYQPNPYRDPPPQPQYYDYQERPPLTARDFERLLQLLIFRHQQLQQRLPYPNFGGNPYLGFNPNPYGSYPGFARQPQYLPYRTPIPPYSENEGMYQAQSPISSAEPAMPYELQRLMPRKKQYHPRYFGAQQSAYGVEDYGSTAPSGSGGNYLPADVREELLYRMLMLALQSEPQPQMIAAPESQRPIDSEGSTTTRTPFIYKKPVRSVQIIGEE